MLEKGRDLNLDELCRLASKMELAEQQSKQMDSRTNYQQLETINKLGKRVEMRKTTQARNVTAMKNICVFAVVYLDTRLEIETALQ